MTDPPPPPPILNPKPVGFPLQGFLLIVLWPAIVCFTAAGTFFTIKYQQQINQQLDTGFGYTICLSFINIVSSQAIQTSTEWEDWHPSLRTNVRPKYDRKYALALALSMTPLYTL